MDVHVFKTEQDPDATLNQAFHGFWRQRLTQAFIHHLFEENPPVRALEPRPPLLWANPGTSRTVLDISAQHQMPCVLVDPPSDTAALCTQAQVQAILQTKRYSADREAWSDSGLCVLYFEGDPAFDQTFPQVAFHPALRSWFLS
jgi:hypothetical protein